MSDCAKSKGEQPVSEPKNPGQMISAECFPESVKPQTIEEMKPDDCRKP